MDIQMLLKLYNIFSIFLQIPFYSEVVLISIFKSETRIY